tara:strand:+ start:14187 stop:14441 length:255 start_codon:yes stop_codon:yes gene_type:complete
MLLYLETDLDRAYKLDCKARTKQNQPWIKREIFRGLYEDLVEVYLQKAQEHVFVDISFEEVPGWVLSEVERTLTNDVEFTREEK